MDEIIRKMLEGLSWVMQKTIADSTGVIMASPSQALGDTFWNTLLHIGKMTIIPFSVMIVAFCIAFELYNVYCRANGKLDMELVTTTVMKFVIPFFVVASSYPLMEMIFGMFGKLVKSVWAAISLSIPATSIDLNAYMASISTLSWWGKLCELLLILVAGVGMYIIAGIVYIVVYFRLFEIVIYWIISPIPIATLVHHEYSQIGKNFLKLFAAVLLQGVLLLLCLAIYSSLLLNKVFEASTWGVAKLVIFGAVLSFFMLKTGSISRRILNTF